MLWRNIGSPFLDGVSYYDYLTDAILDHPPYLLNSAGLQHFAESLRISGVKGELPLGGNTRP